MAEALLARRAGSGPAGDALRRARATAHRIGAEPLRRDIRALATRAGIDLDESAAAPTLPAAPPSQVPPAEERLGLTRREIEGVRVVALGGANARGGTPPFIIDKTLRSHVAD